jgi:hypothetical protein
MGRYCASNDPGKFGQTDLFDCQGRAINNSLLLRFFLDKAINSIYEVVRVEGF